MSQKKKLSKEQRLRSQFFNPPLSASQKEELSRVQQVLSMLKAAKGQTPLAKVTSTTEAEALIGPEADAPHEHLIAALDEFIAATSDEGGDASAVTRASSETGDQLRDAGDCVAMDASAADTKNGRMSDQEKKAKELSTRRVERDKQESAKVPLCLRSQVEKDDQDYFDRVHAEAALSHTRADAELKKVGVEQEEPTVQTRVALEGLVSQPVEVGRELAACHVEDKIKMAAQNAAYQTQAAAEVQRFCDAIMADTSPVATDARSCLPENFASDTKAYSHSECVDKGSVAAAKGQEELALEGGGGPGQSRAEGIALGNVLSFESENDSAAGAFDVAPINPSSKELLSQVEAQPQRISINSYFRRNTKRRKRKPSTAAAPTSAAVAVPSPETVPSGERPPLVAPKLTAGSSPAMSSAAPSAPVLTDLSQIQAHPFDVASSKDYRSHSSRRSSIDGPENEWDAGMEWDGSESSGVVEGIVLKGVLSSEPLAPAVSPTLEQQSDEALSLGGGHKLASVETTRPEAVAEQMAESVAAVFAAAERAAADVSMATEKAGVGKAADTAGAGKAVDTAGAAKVVGKAGAGKVMEKAGAGKGGAGKATERSAAPNAAGRKAAGIDEAQAEATCPVEASPPARPMSVVADTHFSPSGADAPHASIDVSTNASTDASTDASTGASTDASTPASLRWSEEVKRAAADAQGWRTIQNGKRSRHRTVDVDSPENGVFGDEEVRTLSFDDAHIPGAVATEAGNSDCTELAEAGVPSVPHLGEWIQIHAEGIEAARRLTPLALKVETAKRAIEVSWQTVQRRRNSRPISRHHEEGAPVPANSGSEQGWDETPIMQVRRATFHVSLPPFCPNPLHTHCHIAQSIAASLIRAT